MSGRYESTVIKPPMEKISSGKVFKPSMRYLYKNWFGAIMIGVFIFIVTMGFWLGISYLMFVLDDGNPMSWYLNTYVPTWMPLAMQLEVIALSIIVLPALIAIPLYVRTFEYSVISESGNSMPEIYVRKGLINVTKKHVPFRTITNISSRAGPLDRIFGIGNVEIQTAGISGGMAPGPEEKLEGIVFFEEVRDFVLQELRKFRAPYTVGTEVEAEPEVYPQFKRTESTGSINEEILTVLQEIRDILSRERRDR